MTLTPQILQAAEWLQTEASRNPYAEIGIKLVLHDGRTTRIEKLIATKEKPTKTGAHNDKKTYQ